MSNALIFNNFKIKPTVFGEWVINEYDGVSYLYPKNTKTVETLEDFTIEDDFVEDVLNLARYINDIPRLEKEKVYIPTPTDIKISPNVGHESIRDEKFYFYRNDKSKEHINATLLNLFNTFGTIPLHTVYKDFIKFVDLIMVVQLRMQKTDPLLKDEPPYCDSIIPVGLLAYTLHQLFCDFFKEPNSQDFFSKSYDTTITTELTYSRGIWTTVSRVDNLYEALKLYLINDRANKIFDVKNCPYCGKIFVSNNPKQERCSSACTNRANVKKNYDKRKAESHAKAKK